mmetsp:Transcript_26623/g.79431  ORF Transcript_26623/g.79431 Transcript_26623/m.79431 type:complete len:203 (+) Transcript_26623:625-1233(+)
MSPISDASQRSSWSFVVQGLSMLCCFRYCVTFSQNFSSPECFRTGSFVSGNSLRRASCEYFSKVATDAHRMEFQATWVPSQCTFPLWPMPLSHVHSGFWWCQCSCAVSGNSLLIFCSQSAKSMRSPFSMLRTWSRRFPFRRLVATSAILVCPCMPHASHRPRHPARRTASQTLRQPRRGRPPGAIAHAGGSAARGGENAVLP